MKNRLFLILVLGLFFSVPGHAQKSQANQLKQQETSLRTELAAIRQSKVQMEEQMANLSAEDREIFEVEEEQQALMGLDLLYQLSENLRKQTDSGATAEELHAYVTALMSDVPEIILRALDRSKERLTNLQSEKGSAEASELGILEEQISSVEQKVDNLHKIGDRHVTELEKLAMESAYLRERLDESMQFRARLMAGRLKKGLANRTILKKRAAANSDDADLALRLEAVGIAIESNARSLESMIRLMEARGMEVTAFKTILIQSTGDISRGLEISVILQFITSGWEHLVKWLQTQMPGMMAKVLIFGILLFLFHLLAKGAQKGITRAVESSRVNVSRLLGTMIANTSYRLVLFVGIMIGLTQIGISLTPLLAGLGVAGFIIGFALQDTLGNFASGLMILFYRPFDEEDFVEVGGVRGRVDKMSLVSTTILTIDNKTLVVPNSKIWGDVICNFTGQNTRRVDLTFGVSYDADIPHVEKILREVLNSWDLILPDPEPQIKMHELGDSSINFVVRPWVKTTDYWDTYWYLTREVKLRFDKEGITIPFPQRDVHHYYPESDKPDAD